jgi:hypothetical protein
MVLTEADQAPMVTVPEPGEVKSPLAFSIPATSPVAQPALAPTPAFAGMDAPARGPRPWVGLLPMVWFNQAFDLILAPLGPLGRLIGGPNGGTVMGILGILFLAGSLAILLLDRIGWTW